MMSSNNIILSGIYECYFKTNSIQLKKLMHYGNTEIYRSRCLNYWAANFIQKLDEKLFNIDLFGFVEKYKEKEDESEE